jgi:glycosyltransferase involved in cell wall biosynthesis
MKTVCIPSPPSGLGGPAAFMRRLGNTFAESDIEVLNNPTSESSDAILIVQSTRHLRWLLGQKRRGIPIIQRLNGIKGYSSNTSVTSRLHWDDWMRNSVTNFIRRHVASSVIYQSKFSQQIWKDKYGPTNAETHVIYNGCALIPLDPLNRDVDHAKLPSVLVVEASLDEPGVLAKVQGTRDAIANKNVDVEFRVAGRLSETGKARLSAAKNIQYLGRLSHTEVRSEMERATVLLSPETAPSCPNTVLEAMVAKLPVIGFNSGSIMELVDDDTLIIGNQGLHKNPSAAEFDLMAEAAITAINQRNKFAEAGYSRAKELFDIKLIGQKYADVLGLNQTT